MKDRIFCSVAAFCCKEGCWALRLPCCRFPADEAPAAAEAAPLCDADKAPLPWRCWACWRRLRKAGGSLRSLPGLR